MNLIEPILADAATVAAIRRDIHAHPELCFQEERTADVIAKALTDWGIPIHRGLGKTGVVGIVKNGTSNRAVGLRADIDALPMSEHNTFAHASRHPGKMHACWPQPSIWPGTAISTARCTSSSSPPKKAVAGHAK
jgi:hippurate hydrolase